VSGIPLGESTVSNKLNPLLRRVENPEQQDSRIKWNRNLTSYDGTRIPVCTVCLKADLFGSVLVVNPGAHTYIQIKWPEPKLRLYAQNQRQYRVISCATARTAQVIATCGCGAVHTHD
jgi:hypothetical protein